MQRVCDGDHREFVSANHRGGQIPAHIVWLVTISPISKGNRTACEATNAGAPHAHACHGAGNRQCSAMAQRDHAGEDERGLGRV